LVTSWRSSAEPGGFGWVVQFFVNASLGKISGLFASSVLPCCSKTCLTPVTGVTYWM
jgi:hypothetical protein